MRSPLIRKGFIRQISACQIENFMLYFNCALKQLELKGELQIIVVKSFTAKMNRVFGAIFT